MTFKVVVLRRAAEDVHGIHTYLEQRSRGGAERWYRAFLDAVDSLGESPTRWGLAAEASTLGCDVRQRFFKTPRGRMYRLLFLISADEVRILRVRGPGQAPVGPGDLPPAAD